MVRGRGGRAVHPGRVPRPRRRRSIGSWSASATRRPREAAWAAGRGGRRARGRAHRRSSSARRVPAQPRAAVIAAARQADRRRRPPRRRRGLGLADDDGPGRRSAKRIAADSRASRPGCRQTRPLSRLKSLRAILGLDQPRSSRAALDPRHGTARPPPSRPPREAGPARPRAEAGRRAESAGDRAGPDAAPRPIACSSARPPTAAAEPVAIEPAELTRHAAFLGASGSGKTTVALAWSSSSCSEGSRRSWSTARGTSARYARPGMGLARPLDDPAPATRAARLRERVEVALYTPGDPTAGRCRSPSRPRASGSFRPFERRAGRPVSPPTALAGMMNYGDRAARPVAPGDPRPGRSTCSASSSPRPRCRSDADRVHRREGPQPGQRGRPARRQALRQARPGPGDPAAEPGRPPGRPGRAAGHRGAARARPARAPGKTRLSIISTKFLGTNQDVQFWVAQFLMELGRWSEPVAGPGRQLQAVAPVRRGRPVPARRAAAADQGADGEPAAAGPVRRPRPAAGHPEPRRLRLQVPRQHPHLVRRPGQGADRAGQDEADAQRVPRRRRGPARRPRRPASST